MNINIGNKVRVVGVTGNLSTFNGRVGKLEKVFTEVEPPICYVLFEEDELIARSMGVKVPLENLVKVEEEIESEIPEGAREISKADFDAAVAEITDPEKALSIKVLDPMASLTKLLTTKIVFSKAGEAIFRDREVVTMTEDEFISTLWSACDPVVVCEDLDGKMSVRKCIEIALIAMIDFDKLVQFLFGESDNA